MQIARRDADQMPEDPDELDRNEQRRTEARRVELQFQSPDWSLGNVLSWIGFRDPALICRLEGGWSHGGHYLTSRQRLIAYSSGSPRGRKRGKLLVDGPDHALLAALKTGKLTAIRNGEELSRLYWVDKDVRHLKDDRRFWRGEPIIVDWGPPERREAASPLGASGGDRDIPH
jgi:hypothetical protein